VAVHVLGNSTAMHELLEVAHAHDLILVEDTCESLGSRWNGRYLGTLGDFGTYSFYYSHHITTGEGGMVVCDDPDDYDLLVCLRAHGWSRPLSNRVEVERANPYIDPRFLFVNVGYNFRPLEVQAAFGLCQLDRLTAMNRTREENRVRLAHVLRSHPRWRGQVEFPVASPGTEPAWFGFPCLLEVGLQHRHRAYLDYLTSQGVENRPIVSGNFVRQPALKLHGLECDPLAYPQAEAVSHRGFFIGIHTERIADEMLNRLAGIMLGYEFS
jgi:CDP-6-deoxy-D-xylo-4-hexulose-3-dehydrase